VEMMRMMTMEIAHEEVIMESTKMMMKAKRTNQYS
jgi:hypothetical protein